MRPERFVTLCFLYAGVVFLAQYVVVYQFRLDVGSLANLGVSLAILAAGIIRLRNPEAEEQNPAEWGLFTYGMAALCLLLTGLFLGQLAVL